MRGQTSEDTFASRSFPYWVALGSLGFTLVLYFFNTAPAVRERESLRAVKADLQDLRRRYEDAIEKARLQVGPRAAANYDLQALLVAIDQLGYTPSELCAAYPEAAPETPGDGDAPR